MNSYLQDIMLFLQSDYGKLLLGLLFLLLTFRLFPIDNDPDGTA